MAEFETKIAGRTQLDWLQALAQSHAKFVTDLAAMYGNAIRSSLSGLAGLERDDDSVEQAD
jgi:hypothetical protein